MSESDTERERERGLGELVRRRSRDGELKGDLEMERCGERERTESSLVCELAVRSRAA